MLDVHANRGPLWADPALLGLRALPPLVLASASPRRRSLLAAAGLPARVHAIDADETPPPGAAPAAAATAIAARKAAAGVAAAGPEPLVIAADTVVVRDGAILGKPGDHRQAAAMLRSLADRAHEVITGVALRHGDRAHVFHETTQVHVAPLDEAAIAAYVAHMKPYDKAGSYGVQDWFGLVAVERLEGCVWNVIGLPVPRLLRELRAFSMPPAS